MVENIKKLYNSLNNNNREKVVQAIALQYGLAEITVKQHYLTSFNIKEIRQEQILRIMQNAHFEQSKQSRKLATI